MGSIRVSVAWVVVVALGCAAGACQPLYGSKADKLSSPGRVKKPPDEAAVVVEVKYVEDCTTNFRDEGKPSLQTGQSNNLVSDGDQALSQARRATDPPTQAALLVQSVEKYRNALSKDHFNLEATLKLALAYDLVLRKGCALALLKRIAAFQANPMYARKAGQIADEVNDNPQYFKGYRKDAVTAVGR